MRNTLAAAALAAAIGLAMPSAHAVDAARADISHLSTSFNAPGSLNGWNQLAVPGFPAKWQTPRIENGRLVLEPHSSGWFEDMMGGHLYRPIDGNFVVTAKLRVDGTKAQLPQTLFTLAGLFIRAPREGLTAANWQPGRENWMFFSLGTAFPAGTPQFEIKTTFNSLSTLKIADASAVYAGGQTRDIELRVARQGELFSLLYRIEGQREFTLHEQFIRPDLPQRLNVGLTAYADWASVANIYPDFVRLNTMEPARNADLVARVESISFRRPSVDRFPVASFDVKSSFMPEVSQRRIDDLIRN
jgi:regulation of enolase protein 1 (concanavalin A-like superfamily)